MIRMIIGGAIVGFFFVLAYFGKGGNTTSDVMGMLALIILLGIGIFIWGCKARKKAKNKKGI